MGFIDTLPTKEAQVSLIKTLQTVTEGKVRAGGAAGSKEQSSAVPLWGSGQPSLPPAPARPAAALLTTTLPPK
jgi:hypothetical protein